ncbi:MAG: 16S rRNA (guanine(527)-N(7))-methyltransferase RsmG [Rhodobacteraceae bacterium]|nr:MAG: 16S rRNA (guanine(527)-N(7))-methyltransferase RsmG [Paracoccaceae bacterium]
MTATQIAGIDVSRETLTRLTLFADLLRKWTPAINLVATGTIPDMWTRHIVDSAQLFCVAPPDARHWLDLGSGGGLPGIVCAILAAELQPDCRFTLVESDARKSAFLMTAKRELSLPITVLTERAETLAPQKADLVTARALAPLPRLLPLVARHLAKGGVAVLPKGKNHATELAAARREWQFTTDTRDSLTDPAARVLVLKELTRV